MRFDWASLIEALIALGIFGTIRRSAAAGWKRWRTGGRTEQERANIAATAELQETSLELVTGIRSELNAARSESAAARAEAASARGEVNDLRRVMDETLEDWIGWMQRAKTAMEEHHLPVEPLPVRPSLNRRAQ